MQLDNLANSFVLNVLQKDTDSMVLSLLGQSAARPA